MADGSKASIYSATGKGRISLEDEQTVEHPPSRELLTDRPGRAFDRVGGGRHAIERSSDPHTRAETDFLTSLVERLDRALERRAFDTLTIVAPPRALGVLRAALPRRLAMTVIQQLKLDLTGLTKQELERHLQNYDAL